MRKETRSNRANHEEMVSQDTQLCVVLMTLALNARVGSSVSCLSTQILTHCYVVSQHDLKVYMKRRDMLSTFRGWGWGLNVIMSGGLAVST